MLFFDFKSIFLEIFRIQNKAKREAVCSKRSPLAKKIEIFIDFQQKISIIAPLCSLSIEFHLRKSGRVVEGGGLENR